MNYTAVFPLEFQIMCEVPCCSPLKWLFSILHLLVPFKSLASLVSRLFEFVSSLPAPFCLVLSVPYKWTSTCNNIVSKLTLLVLQMLITHIQRCYDALEFLDSSLQCFNILRGVCVGSCWASWYALSKHFISTRIFIETDLYYRIAIIL